jgi:hypothetical protein
MNEKPVKVPMDFNEALRRIAKTPKGLVVDDTKQEETAKKKKPSAPAKGKSR